MVSFLQRQIPILESMEITKEIVQALRFQHHTLEILEISLTIKSNALDSKQDRQ